LIAIARASATRLLLSAGQFADHPVAEPGQSDLPQPLLDAAADLGRATAF